MQPVSLNFYSSSLKESIPGCKGVWTVYHKNARSHVVESSKATADDDEYHAYLIISLETRTMVISFCLVFKLIIYFVFLPLLYFCLFIVNVIAEQIYFIGMKFS